MNHNTVQAVAGYLEVQHNSQPSPLTLTSSLNLRNVSLQVKSDRVFPSILPEGSGIGRIVVYGDSSCFDLNTDPTQQIGCEKFIDSFLQYVKNGTLPSTLKLSKKRKANDVLSDISTSSEYEFLDEIPYYSPLLSNASHAMSKQLEKELQQERAGRAWELI